MLTRRNFLKGLLSSVAAAALVKNGIVQPEQVIAKPKRTVFDMAANTWREKRNVLPGHTWYGTLAQATMWDIDLSAWNFARLAPNFGSIVAMPYRDSLRVGDSYSLANSGWVELPNGDVPLGHVVDIDHATGACLVRIKSEL